MSKKLVVLLLAVVFLLAAENNLVIGDPAYNPNPAEGLLNVSLHKTLSWAPAPSVSYQNVYIGTSPDSLSMVASGLYDYESSYDPGILQPAQTYYWRVDSDFDGSIDEGPVWSFATENGIVPADGAVNVSVSAVLKWMPRSTALSHNLYLGTSSGDMAFKGNYQVDSNSYNPGGLTRGKEYFWRIDEVNNLGTVTGNVWSFKTEGLAYGPTPAHIRENVSLSSILCWTPGIQSGSQDVYLGTSFDDVNNASLPAGDFNRDGSVGFADVAVLAGQWLTNPGGAVPSADLDGSNNVNFVDLAMLANTWQDSAGAVFKSNRSVGSKTYNPGTLAENTTYYWRIDEIENSNTYKGDVWSFTTLTAVPGLPAFPGAEGWGWDTPAARGGRVIKVTNLNSSGPGSLAAACATPGPRIVVFEVSGVITCQLDITQPHIIIAGQTAPGGGITIQGRVRSYGYGVHDAVIRHVRVRPLPTTGSGGDVFQMGGSNAYNLILDHCSVAWGNDENIDIYNGHHMNIQWCTVEESDDEGHSYGTPHNYGMISAATGSGAVSAHHNLWAHHLNRVPCMAPYLTNATDDFRNNVVYDVYQGLTHEGHQISIQSPLNNFYNYWKRGPSTWNSIYPFATTQWVSYYIANNYFEDWGLKGNPKAPGEWSSPPTWVRYNPTFGVVLTEPGYVPPITTQAVTNAASAAAMRDLVLAKAGAWPRDRVTLRTINEVQTGGNDPCTGGSYGRHAPLAPTHEWFMEGLAPTAPAPDSDNDGIPDLWESTHGLDLNNPHDSSLIVPAGASAGDRHMNYTYIEYYINELADNLVP